MSELVSQHKDDVLLIQFTSQKILSDALIARIGRELLELADEANGKMVLDFQGVTFMSAAMIGKIVLVKKKCDKDKIQLKCCNLAPCIEEVFAIIWRNQHRNFFGIYDSAEEVMRSFRRGWFQ